ncbi:MAG: GNAT family N-acetyltransferase [Alphaproteobacteria bacterium]
MKIVRISHDHPDADKAFNELKEYNNQFEPKVDFEKVVLVAEDNGKFMGSIDAHRAWDFLEISNMVVLKKRKGIGSKLMAEAESYAKTNKLKKILLWTMDFQAPEFYKKMGFKEYAVLPDVAGKHSCHYFVKEIKI